MEIFTAEGCERRWTSLSGAREPVCSARGRHVRRVSQPTQCQTLRSGQGDAAPPLNPQLPAPLPGQRAVGAAIANRVAGAIPADRLSVTGAARAHARRSTPPIGTRPRRQAVTRSLTWTALGHRGASGAAWPGSIGRDRTRLARWASTHTAAERGRPSGSKGRSPSPAPLWVQRVCWLRTLKGS